MLLKSGNHIPHFLFGTYKKINNETVKIALENGIYAFDLAHAYGTEDLVLSSIKEYLNENKIKNLERSDFYFCYKLNSKRLRPELIIEDVNNLLNKLKDTFQNDENQFIDMLMIHSPNHSIPIELTWSYMRSLKVDGIIKEIGVSNFNQYHLEYMRKNCEEMPSINQIEVNPFFYDKEFINYHFKNNIRISAYRSGLNKEVKEIDNELVNNWKFTHGFQTVSISMNPKHIEKFTSFNILDEKTMNDLDKLNTGIRTCEGSWSAFDFKGSSWTKSSFIT